MMNKGSGDCHEKKKRARAARHTNTDPFVFIFARKGGTIHYAAFVGHRLTSL